MGKRRSRIARLAVCALVSAGFVATAGPATAAGCITLDTSTTYTGTSGSDSVCVTSDGTYDINTGGGNDTVKVLDGDAVVDADLGSGNDAYTALAGSDDTVDGGTGNDKLTTGPGDDTISGGDGKDAIAAGAGDDTVDGGTGDDKITGDAGNDTLAGGAGNDTITDKTGDDAISGGDGNDKLAAGTGDDTVDGDAGTDKITGDAGNDTLDGGAGNDTISDTAGDDTLDGGSGDDKLLAGNGIDSLDGGDGADLLNGGAGDDAFDGTATDTAVSGTGDAVCSDESTLDLTCAYGAVVASVDQAVNTTATGWRVSVKAHALDFDGVGVTKIALAEHAWTTASGGGMYLSATPTLVSGTMQNGVFEATFDLTATPPSGQLGVRVFTTGFSLEAWSVCTKGGQFDDCGNQSTRRWPCISWSVASDRECGFANTLGAVASGFPKGMRVMVFDRAAPPEPTLTRSTPISPAPAVTAGSGTKLFSYGYILSPPQTEAIDRTWVVPYYPGMTDQSDIDCRFLGPGSHTFKAATYAMTQFPNGEDYGWSAWSPGTTWSKTCGQGLRLTVSTAGSGSGTVSSNPIGIDCGNICGADFFAGTTLTLTARPAPGSVFSGWSGGGCGGSENTCNITIADAANVTATFAPAPPSTLSITKTGSGSGTVSSEPAGLNCGTTCSAGFPTGLRVRLVATPAPGSAVIGWSGGGCSGFATACTVTLDAAMDVTVVFGPPPPVLTVSSIGSGTVSSNPGAINCSNCSSPFTAGSTVILTASPASGWRFDGWSGSGCSGTSWCLVTMDASTTVTAHFSLVPLPLTISVERSGSGTGTVWTNPYLLRCGDYCSTQFPGGSTVTLYATPERGSVFAGWSGDTCTGTGPCVITRGGLVRVQATFVPTPTLALTVSRAGLGSGRVSSNPTGIDCSNTCSANFQAGTVVSLVATPAPGSVFAGWSGGGCGGTKSCVLNSGGTTNVTATFSPAPPPVLAVSKTGPGSGTVTSNDAAINCGTTCTTTLPADSVATLSATPAPGSAFAGWSGGGCSGTGTCVVRAGTAANIAARFAPDSSVASVSSDTSFSCALFFNGSVKCWGNNLWEQLGRHTNGNVGDEPGEMGSNLPVVNLGAGQRAIQLAVGDVHACVLLESRSVKCWGYNADGQLGLGDTANRGYRPGDMGDNLPAVDLGTGRTATQITVGGGHTCVILDNGTVKCWGDNTWHGSLGLGDTADRGDQPGEMGDLLPAVDLGTGRTATQITAGAYHTCALLDNRSVKCWGNSGNSQLGLGNEAPHGTDPGQMGDNLPAVDLGAGRTAQRVVAGSSEHTCALLDDGTLKCWGANRQGQLGIGDPLSRGKYPNEMGDGLPAVDLGTDRDIVQIAAGDSQSCALFDNGSVKCWGGNDNGQLGLGDTENRGDQPGEAGTQLPVIDLGPGRTAVRISAGGGHSCAVLDDGTAKCWGQNDWGALGLGDGDHRGDNAGEMGDDLPALQLHGQGLRLTVSPGGSGSGTVSSDPAGIDCGTICGADFFAGTAVKLTATPAPGSLFSGWSGGGCSGTGTCQVTMDAAKTVTATFALKPVALTVTRIGTGSGTVTSNPTGISCGTTCTTTFPGGTTVTLTATPAADSTFTGWSGAGCSGTSPCVISNTGGNVTVTATFALLPLNLTVAKAGTGFGNVSSNPAGIECGTTCTTTFPVGTTVTLTATPVPGSTFTGWSDSSCSGTSPCVISNTGGNVTVTATFALLPLNLTVAKAGTGSGTVTSSPTGIGCGLYCSKAFPAGTTVTLTATPAADSTFTGWSGAGCSGTSTCVISNTGGNVTVTATFAKKPLTLTIAKAGTGSGNVSSTPAGIACGDTCTSVFPVGTTVTLTATPAADSTFTGWSGAGCSGTSTCVISNTGGNVTVTATFAKKPLTLTVTTAGARSGTVTSTPAGIACGNTCTSVFPAGTTVTLTATPAPGWEFGGWSGGGCTETGTCVIDAGGTVSVAASFVLTSPVANVTTGSSHSCVRFDNGAVKCWGNNTAGQLGIGDQNRRGDEPGEMGRNLPTVDLGTGRSAKQIAVGSANTCALLDNGTLKCWGNNEHGQLGLGDINARGDNAYEMGDNLPAVNLGSGRTVTQVAIGFNSACALLDNGTVKCWGSSYSGKLGLGDTTSRGDQAGEMGDNLPAVDLGAGRTAIAVSVGQEHACALLDNGTVKCWGNNYYGQLGLGNRDTRGDEPGEMGDNLPAVNLGTGRSAVQVAAARYSTCARLDNDTVKCWGLNSAGQLGLGDPWWRGGAPGEMGDNLPAVNLGAGRSAKSLVSGDDHTCAQLDNGSFKCWGANDYGQLGLGNTNNRGDQSGEMGDSLPGLNLGSGRTILALGAGGRVSCAVLDDGTVKCWGTNEYGQLGLGDTNARGDQPDEMGDNLPAVQVR